jgi:hypothetical protein
MTFYKYDGKFLLDGGKFAISEDCCCGESTCYKLRECDADSNTCNAPCDHPIPDQLTVKLSGLGGDWDGYNGVHVVDWDNACNWSKDLPQLPGGQQTNTLSLYWGGGKWNIGIDGFAIACIIYISQNGIADECAPHGTYSTLVECEDDYGGAPFEDEECVDTDTCEKTTMVAVVSYTDPTSDVVGANEIGVDDDLSTYVFGDVIYYNSICYYFVGPITCPTSPTTMTTWEKFSSCANCNTPNECNDPPCDIADTFTVTISGCAGDFAVFNGVTVLDWVSGCNWGSIELSLGWTGSTWHVGGELDEFGCNLYVKFDDTPDSCDPVGIYSTVAGCTPWACSDGSSCDNSTMVAVVS